MDMIYTDAARRDLGVLQSYEMDLAFGADENDFTCTVSRSSHCCEAGSFLYMEGTEYGGIVDGVQSKSADEEVVYSGRTWHGLLGSRVILPLQAGETAPSGVTVRQTDTQGNSLAGRYLILSGDANGCLAYLVERLALTDLFEVTAEAAPAEISGYQFGRYVDGYTGIAGMLAAAGLKLKMECRQGKVFLWTEPLYNWAEDQSYDSDLVEFNAKKLYRSPNHLICLGRGDLEKRMVVHLYADAKGSVSRVQSQFGMEEYTASYENTAAESEEELIRTGTERLKALWTQDSLEISLTDEMEEKDVGDIVGAIDNVTGLAVSAAITKKVVSIRNGTVSIALSTSPVKTTGGGAGTGGATSAGGGETYKIGHGLKVENGTLSVDVVNAVEKDNTRPITSAAVHVTVGNIEALMKTI